ncbi:CPBP family intramembrane metalloprotease [Methylicorpusculum oleiharenae]|uniref:CPBP family intramembrane glutamic endopeptidase n=1 Tax=Methylicorpusculum oleiharenae TaxID=1338687 RepID=UPI0013571801|nr:CPBP family intramembrane glutamic endopeptidase [Methylicorpusculum oleiharenae]MCD2449798.1 CPBP family intramembrane metalloprotease [Methylicorpusculum oleiharenae]
MKYLFYSLMPLGILLATASLAIVFSYGILLVLGDVLLLSKLTSKVTQVFLIISIFPIKHYLNLSWSELGFVRSKTFFNQLLIGLGLGLITLLPVFLILFALDVNVFDTDRLWTLGSLLQKTAIALVLALLISLIEEPLFRGVLLSGLNTKMPVMAAILISSTYYASLHFLKSHTVVSYQDISIPGGFMLLGEALLNVIDPKNLQAFLALLMVGLFLGIVRAVFGFSLGMVIGCHTAWVWQIKMNKSLFNVNPDSDYLYLVSSYDGVIGPLVTGWMALVMTGYWLYSRYLKIH